MTRGLWVKVSGERGFADSDDPVVTELMQERGGFPEHYHVSGDPLGDITVWGWAAEKDGTGVLNVFVTALASSLTGEMLPFVGSAFVTGPEDEEGALLDLTPEQESVLSGTVVRWPEGN